MSVIRISGHPGSGKTTLSKKLSEKLGYTYYYTGGIFREMAKERNMSIEDFYRELSQAPETEAEIDARLRNIMNTKDNIIVEGRIAPFQNTRFSFQNILLTVNPKEGARRQCLRPENANISLTEMMRLTEERIANEREHFKHIHGIEDHFSPKQFHIVLDTTTLTPDDVFNSIFSELVNIKLDRFST